MPTQPAIPPLLVPYVSPPPRSSLTLVTSVLGATGNWLILRFLFSALSAGRAGGPRSNVAEGADGLGGDFNERNVKVVLVSFLRGWEFWRAEAKRLGLDLARLADQGRFAFVDGLSELFYLATPAPASTPFPGQSGTAPPRTTLPVRSHPGVVPARAPAPASAPTARNGLSKTTQTQGRPGPAKKLHLSDRGVAALDSLEKDILAVVDGLKAKKGADGAHDESDVLLVIDQPDLLLAATGPSQGIGATEMEEWIMGLEERVYSTIVILSSDSPLIHNAPASASQQATPLETEHAAFVVGMAHQARTVMQLRNLDTGAARDVSGVLRISKGGAWEQDEQDRNEGVWEEKEVLYFVQRDAGVRVFGRGE